MVKGPSASAAGSSEGALELFAASHTDLCSVIGRAECLQGKIDSVHRAN